LAERLDGQLDDIIGTPEEGRTEGESSGSVDSENGRLPLSLDRHPPDGQLTDECVERDTSRGILLGPTFSQEHDLTLRRR
jgi:hypothetical protein